MIKKKKKNPKWRITCWLTLCKQSLPYNQLAYWLRDGAVIFFKKIRFMQFTCWFCYFQLFPYHLAEYVCRVMRISPFRYYCDMIFEVMRNGKRLPSLTNLIQFCWNLQLSLLFILLLAYNEFSHIMSHASLSASLPINITYNFSYTNELLTSLIKIFLTEATFGGTDLLD